MDNKPILLVQTKSHVILISNLAAKELFFGKAPKEKRLERIHDNRFWDSRLLLTSGSKNGQLNINLRIGGSNISAKIDYRYQQGRVLFKSAKDSNRIHVFNFKGTKFSLIRTTIHQQK